MGGDDDGNDDDDGEIDDGEEKKCFSNFTLPLKVFPTNDILADFFHLHQTESKNNTSYAKKWLARRCR